MTHSETNEMLAIFHSPIATFSVGDGVLVLVTVPVARNLGYVAHFLLAGPVLAARLEVLLFLLLHRRQKTLEQNENLLDQVDLERERERESHDDLEGIHIEECNKFCCANIDLSSLFL